MREAPPSSSRRSTSPGTHAGPLVGADGEVLPPAGARVTVSFVGVHTAPDRLLMSSRVSSDPLVLLAQIGALGEN